MMMGNTILNHSGEGGENFPAISPFPQWGNKWGNMGVYIFI